MDLGDDGEALTGLLLLLLLLLLLRATALSLCCSIGG